jgi:transcription factor SPN1
VEFCDAVYVCLGLTLIGRRRALDRAMDAALRNPNKRRARKVDGIDLADMADAEIEDVRKRMTEAAERDAVARRAGKPAMYKLKMLPEVVSLLNRNTFVQSLVDPEINLLEAVRFFLEPLEDGALPAYNIQRDLFAALAKLPITKDTLFASGIGKVILFYTKSKRPEPGIKRQAEKLLADWTRPILQRTDDYSKKVFQTAEYDPKYVHPFPLYSHSTTNKNSKIPIRPATSRIREGQKPDDGKSSTRARVDINTKSYSIVPLATSVKDGVYARPIGASGEDRFRKMKARQLAAAGKGRKR